MITQFEHARGIIILCEEDLRENWSLKSGIEKIGKIFVEIHKLSAIVTREMNLEP